MKSPRSTWPRIQERVDRENAETAEIEASRALAKTIISKAKRHPYTEHPPVKTGWAEITLDDVDEAMAKTQAKVVVVGSGTLIVHAARQDELIAAIPKDAPKFTAKQLAGYTNQVYALMHYLEVLGPSGRLLGADRQTTTLRCRRQAARQPGHHRRCASSTNPTGSPTRPFDRGPPGGRVRGQQDRSGQRRCPLAT